MDPSRRLSRLLPAPARPLLCWMTLFCGFSLVVLHRFATAGLQDVFAADFGLGTVSFALLSSSYFYLYPLMQVPAGFCLDIWGPNRVAALAFFCMCLGALLFGASGTFTQLMMGRVLISFGASFIWGALLKVQGLYFSGRVFALLAGFGAVAASMGIILAGTPLMHSVNLLGWRETFYLLAVVSLALLLGLCASCGLANSASPGRKEPQPLGQRADWQGALAVLKSPPAWLLFMCHFGIYGSYAAFLGIWSYPFLVGPAGYSTAGAAFFVTWMGLGYTAGGPLLGYLSDRPGYGRRKALLLSCAACAASMTVLLLIQPGFISPNIVVYPALFSIGFFTPGLILTMVFSRELHAPALSGVAVGVANSGGFVGAAVAQLAAGQIMERGREAMAAADSYLYPWPVYRNLVLLSVLLLLIAFGAVYMVREPNIRPHQPG